MNVKTFSTHKAIRKAQKLITIAMIKIINSCFLVKLTIVAFLFFSASCNKNKQEGVTINYLNQVTISAGLNVLDTHIFELPFENPRLGVFLPNTDTAQIESILPSLLTIRNLQSNTDLSFIRRAIVRISADGLPEREVAFREEIPFNTGLDLNLIPSLSELRPYFLKDNFRLIVRLNFRNITPETMTLQVDSGFQVMLVE